MSDKKDVELNVWKSIGVDHALCSVSDFEGAYEESAFELSGWVTKVLEEQGPRDSLDGDSVDFIRVPIKEFGFEGKVPGRQVYMSAWRHKLKLCPLSVGLQLPLHFDDIVMGEKIIIATELIQNSSGGVFILYVMYDRDSRRIGGYYSHPDVLWSPEDHFVFLRGNNV